MAGLLPFRLRHICAGFTGCNHLALLIKSHSPPGADFIDRAQTPDTGFGFRIDGADPDAG